MKLSELAKIWNEQLEKYGDRDVVVDVDARTFNYYLAEIVYAGMCLSDEDYTNEPYLLSNPATDMFIIGLEN